VNASGIIINVGHFNISIIDSTIVVVSRGSVYGDVVDDVSILLSLIINAAYVDPLRCAPVSRAKGEACG